MSVNSTVVSTRSLLGDCVGPQTNSSVSVARELSRAACGSGGSARHSPCGSAVAKACDASKGAMRSVGRARTSDRVCTVCSICRTSTSLIARKIMAPMAGLAHARSYLPSVSRTSGMSSCLQRQLFDQGSKREPRIIVKIYIADVARHEHKVKFAVARVADSPVAHATILAASGAHADLGAALGRSAPGDRPVCFLTSR
jgi:hypothetical protein